MDDPTPYIVGGSIGGGSLIAWVGSLARGFLVELRTHWSHKREIEDRETTTREDQASAYKSIARSLATIAAKFQPPEERDTVPLEVERAKSGPIGVSGH